MIDMVEVVHVLAQHNLIRLGRVTGNYQQIHCPIHSGGQERRPSCGILLKDEYKNGQRYPAGFCHCFACGYAQPLDVMVTDILKSRSISTSGLEWLKANIPGFEVDDLVDSLLPETLTQQLNAAYAVNYIQSLTQSSATIYVSEEELAKYRYTVPYMYERGLTDELIERFDIGVDMNYIPEGRKKPVPCITFPVRDIQGNTLFIVRRSINNKFFYIPSDTTKPIYGIDQIPTNCSSVLIVESCFNALTAWKYGQPAVALLGTGNTYQINQLRGLGVRQFILGFDPDDAGRKATAKLKRALKDVAIVWSYKGIPEGKDINDLSEQEFRSLSLV